MEKSFEGLENLHARIINKLRSSKAFDVLDAKEIAHFCIFVLMQRQRTKQRKKENEETIDNLAKEYLKMKVETGEVDSELPDGRDILDLLDRFRVTHEAPLSFSLLNALTGVDLILDLEVVIVVNGSDKGFVLSDDPVVHDNPRFKNEIDRFLIGLQSSGLQIFVPISDMVQIMLYDPASYFVKYSDKEKRRVITTSEEVVTSLNDMQIINAYRDIYYRNVGREQEFKESQQRLMEYVQMETNIFEVKSADEHNFDTENEIIETGYELPKYSPYLPFVNQRIDAEFTIERRPGISERHNEYIDEILEEAEEEQEEIN